MWLREAYVQEKTRDRQLKESRQQAKTHRLARELRNEHPGWVARQGRWLLCQSGRLLLAAGRRLERQGLPQTSLVER